MKMDKIDTACVVKASAYFAAALLVGSSLFSSVGADDGGGWPRYSYDYANTNHNSRETKISPQTAPSLRRAWQTFNDNRFVPTPPPTGFVLGPALGLSYPSSVVGVVSPPIIRDGTIYYIDELGTLFARDAKTGAITDPRRHWTTTLVDPDFDSANPKIIPDLYYTALAVTRKNVWVVSSVYGRVHAVKRRGGAEVDFNPATPAVDPFTILPQRIFSSSLGDPVIIQPPQQPNRVLLITGLDVILNDAIVQGGNAGVMVALDITNPERPFLAWQTPTIDINPATDKRYGTGVSAGSGLAVDLKSGLLFGGTGQNTTPPYLGYPNPSLAPDGYIDREDAMWALDYLTGKIVWVNQLHRGDVFDLNHPDPAGPNNGIGALDADVLAPPVLFRIKHKGEREGEETDDSANGDGKLMVGDGSKGGLFRVVNAKTGQTVWDRQISKRTGLGGIQAGAAYADGSVYVAGFEGIDEGFSDAQFDAPASKFKNAFFATFSPAFWADVEDATPDTNPATGMRTKLYKLDAATGKSQWHFENGQDYVELLGGAELRHVSIANGLVYATTSAGQLFVLDAHDGHLLFRDQTLDLNVAFNLGLGKPQHASMNAGTLISDGMVYVPYGGQNNPSGGIIAYKLP